MNKILEDVRAVGLMPVIKLTDPGKAVDLSRALIAGGIPVAEVTFRAAGAEKAIRAIADALPEMLVGAGTVINVEQAKLALDAGAKYIVSPGFVPEVVQFCIDHDLPVIPGCANASEVSVACNMGLEVVKFFPAEAMGGLKVLKALAGPLGNMKFIPTGGINPNNLKEYLAFNKIIACGGSWMVPANLVDNCDWGGITALAREAVTAMLDVTVQHIGINSKNIEEAKTTAKLFEALFGLKRRECSASCFVSDQVEIMNGQGRGENGHIALGVTDVERAMRYYGSQGMEFDLDTVKKNDQGRVKFVYFKGSFGGFHVHLVEK